MDSGDVEFSGGAVDFKPDNSPKEKSGGPVDMNSVGKVAAEDIRFRATDIDRSDDADYFDKPEDKKRKERAERRRIEAEAKRVSKESKKKDKISGASSDVVAQEEALKKEQSRLENEHRQARIRGFLGRRAKRWYIYAAAIVVVALTVCGVIFVPKIIKDVNDANDRKYVNENMTPILRFFEEVAGRELSETQINELVAKYNGDLVAEYYPQAGAVYPKGRYLEAVKMLPKFDESGMYHLFSYEKRSGEDIYSMTIVQSGVAYSHNSEAETYKSVSEAIDAYLLGTRKGEK